MRIPCFLRLTVCFFLFGFNPLLALAEEGNTGPQIITYSAGYRIKGANPHNVVEMGVITPCGNDMCLKFARYDGVSNISRTPTNFQHQMHSPTRAPKCADERVTTIRPSESRELKVKFKPANDGFEIETNGLYFHWRIDPKSQRAYELTEISAPNAINGLDQAVGFAFISKYPVIGTVGISQVSALFKGEIFHKNTQMGVDDVWQYKPSSIDFRRFSASADGDTLIMTEPGHRDVIKRVGKPLWVQNSIVLARENDVISPVIQEYGHDFNMNGCFDEFGHNKFLLPVADEGDSIRAFVYVEYSPDKYDGVPMISVGRYYK